MLVSGFGQDGPTGPFPPMNLTIQARGGAMGITGEKDGAPAAWACHGRPGGPICRLRHRRALFDRKGLSGRGWTSVPGLPASLLTYMATYHPSGPIPKPQVLPRNPHSVSGFKAKDLYLVVACPTDEILAVSMPGAGPRNSPAIPISKMLSSGSFTGRSSTNSPGYFLYQDGG